MSQYRSDCPNPGGDVVTASMDGWGADFYEVVLDRMPDGVLIAERAGERLVFSNEQAECLWEHKLPTDLQEAYRVLEAYHPDGSRYRMEDWPLVRALRTGEYTVHEVARIIRGGGSEGFLHIAAAPIRDSQGEVVAAVAVESDVTQLLRAEQQRERSLETLESAHDELRDSQRGLKEMREDLGRQADEQTSELERAEARLQDLTGQLLDAEQQERQRIAGQIHDEVAQTLATLKIRLSLLGSSPEAQGLQHEVERLAGMVDEAIRQARALMADLSLPVLHQSGLAEALRWFAARVREDHGIDVKIVAPEQVPRLEQQVEVMMFQAARELIVNVMKHAQANQVEVALRCHDTGVELDVRDDGVGFDASKIEMTSKGGFGLYNIARRLAYLGGDLIIDSKPQQGSTVTVSVPVPCRMVERDELPITIRR